MAVISYNIITLSLKSYALNLIKEEIMQRNATANTCVCMGGGGCVCVFGVSMCAFSLVFRVCMSASVCVCVCV